jgi:hypothetical protein
MARKSKTGLSTYLQEYRPGQFRFIREYPEAVAAIVGKKHMTKIFRSKREAIELQPLAIVEFSEFVAATLAASVPMEWQPMTEYPNPYHSYAGARLVRRWGAVDAPMIDVTSQPLAVVTFAAVVENCGIL